MTVISGRRGLKPELRIARRIVTLRMLEGMSRVDLARAAQIDEGRMSEIEQGIAPPRGKELFQLAAALKVEFENLTADVAMADMNGAAVEDNAKTRASTIEESFHSLRRDHEFQDLLKQLAVRVSKQ